MNRARNNSPTCWRRSVTRRRFVDIRGIDGLLHLKSGLAYLGDRLVITEELYDGLASESQTNGLRYDHIFTDFALLRVDSEQAYAANCIRVNDYLLLAAGYQSFEESLRELGYQTIALEMSEFQKMDGGLSCLSLRF